MVVTYNDHFLCSFSILAVERSVTKETLWVVSLVCTDLPLVLPRTE